MGKAISGMFSQKSSRVAQMNRAEDQAARLAEQSRTLNDRNSQLESEASTARSGRRGRRLLAYKGQETGLRGTLGA